MFYKVWTKSGRIQSAFIQQVMARIGCLMALSLLFGYSANAQVGFDPFPVKPSSELLADLYKLKVVGNFLYVAAHPDDENTRMLAPMNKEKGLRTAYLSLTRGDGGQNLFGKEIREELGVLRTQELLGARRNDGGEQYFTRANDFGYSRSPMESLEIWEKDKVLSDVVWVIRKFKPDVIVTRFSPDSGRTHGHHTASARLAMEAFEKAADPKAFPEQLRYVETWQAKRVYWNTSHWFYGSRDYDKTGLLEMNVGRYSPLVGRSFGEMAAKARSEHRCQGFGVELKRGDEIEYLQYLAGDSATSDLFEGIDLTWKRVKGGGAIEKLIDEAIQSFDVMKPNKALPALAALHKKMKGMETDNPYIAYKIKRLEEIMLHCAGVWLEATARTAEVAQGEDLSLTAKIISRAGVEVKLKGISSPLSAADTTFILPANVMATVPVSGTVSDKINLSSPYWLDKPSTLGMYTVDEQNLIGNPESPISFPVTYRLEIAGVAIDHTISALFKEIDPAKAEVYAPIAVVSKATVTPNAKSLLFADQSPKEVQVKVKSFAPSLSCIVKANVPEGWSVSPASVPMNFEKKTEEQTAAFTLTPPKGASEGEVRFHLEDEAGQMISDRALTVIDYDHIPRQTILPKSALKVSKLALEIPAGLKVGYIEGAGDVIPQSLDKLGCEVTILAEDEILGGKLAMYDAIIIGIRAYNVNPRMEFYHKALMEYVAQGGTMLVQYSTSYRLKTDKIGPYPFKIGRGRVTREEAEMNVLDAKHRVFNAPNKIGASDFDNWVQERYLYFAETWDEHYTPLFSSHDPGDKPQQGGLLYASYGKGHFVYAGYSWFRQLLANVPGAYKLFVNLISLGKN